MAVPPAARIAAYRARRRAAGLPDSSQAYKRQDRAERRRTRPHTNRHFVGCDGEGCGVDEKGRQLFMLFRMGERELYTGKPLSTWELLDFICDDDSGGILVGFAFGYDVTMILRDLSEQQQRRLFEPKTFEPGHSPYTWFKDFDIDYLPKNYLRVKRVKVIRVAGSERREPIEGSQRTIYETFGFFQKSFLKCLYSFDVGTEEQRRMIAANKDKRADFTEIDDEVKFYCKMECYFLAELMTKLREYCHAAGIVPKTWNGAGKLAAALHALHDTPKSKDVALFVPDEVMNLANMAYYGGRFEITRTGMIEQKVYEYDICSAYPDAMRNLPCLCHGKWTAVDGKSLRVCDELFVAAVTFRFSRLCSMGGFPVRSREGHLYWPSQGGGIYWSPEIRSAEALGAKVNYKHGWVYKKACDCQPFDWVEPLYDYRRSIGSQGPGYPIKLAINSLYGKLAQRKGNGVYNNMIWAGLITARTRAKINSAIALAPSSIVMVATDAVYSLEPLELAIGERLGQWEAAELDGLFIVQPGLYWSPDKRKRKSRGLSGKFFEEPGRTEAFEAAWSYFRAEATAGVAGAFPAVTVPVPGFVGLKLALARGKPETAGKWIADTREISFDYRNKRASHVWNGSHIELAIKPGSPGLLSLPHRDFLKAGGEEPWEQARLMLEEQPDWVDMSAPFED